MYRQLLYLSLLLAIVLLACSFTNQLTTTESNMDELVILASGDAVSFNKGDLVVRFNGATREWTDEGDSYYADFTINVAGNEQDTGLTVGDVLSLGSYLLYLDDAIDTSAEIIVSATLRPTAQP